MKIKTFFLAAIILSLSLLLLACGQKADDTVTIISEQQAKEVGLALINRAFGASETEALVQYQELPGVAAEDNGIQHYGAWDSKRVYTLMVASKEAGKDSYYAEVDAQLGIAYLAERNMKGIVLSAEQQAQADALGTLETYDGNSLLPTQQAGEEIVSAYMKTLLGEEDSTLRVFSDMIETDSVDFPKVRLEYFAISERGKVYNITLCWPTMELIAVDIRD